MPRRSVADAAETRRRIVERSVALARNEGLEALTFGRLADDLGLSKSGILRHFDTKERLQLAAVEDATRDFVAHVVARGAEAQPGLERLLAFCDAWIDYLADRRAVGGCFFTPASAEFDGRPGPVRDAVAGAITAWQDALGADVDLAVANGDLAADTDRDQVVFELAGLVMGLNQHLLLRGDRRAPARAHRAVRRVLGLPADTHPPRRRRRREAPAPA